MRGLSAPLCGRLPLPPSGIPPTEPVEGAEAAEEEEGAEEEEEGEVGEGFEEVR